MTIDGPSWVLGFVAAFPFYWFLDSFVVPRFAHLLAVVARNRERV